MVELQWNRAFALEQTAGDEELLEELITLFKDSSAGDVKQLAEAVAEDNVDGVVHAAHSLKGAAASLGFEAIRQLALEMEADARNGSVGRARDGLAAMESLLAQLAKL